MEHRSWKVFFSQRQKFLFTFLHKSCNGICAVWMSLKENSKQTFWKSQNYVVKVFRKTHKPLTLLPNNPHMLNPGFLFSSAICQLTTVHLLLMNMHCAPFFTTLICKIKNRVLRSRIELKFLQQIFSLTWTFPWYKNSFHCKNKLPSIIHFIKTNTHGIIFSGGTWHKNE
jgi:hypothetical protein